MAFRVLDGWIDSEIQYAAYAAEEKQALIDQAEEILTLLTHEDLEPTFAFDTPYIFVQYLHRRLENFIENGQEYFLVEFEDADSSLVEYGATLVPNEQLKHCGFLVGTIFAGADPEELFPFAELLCVDIEENYPTGYFFIERNQSE